MNVPTEWTRELAMEYFSLYARFEKIPLDESIVINSTEKIRGDVGAAELEYRENDKLFIVRGLINKKISKANKEFKELLLTHLYKLNENPDPAFNGALFEFDTTAYELQEDYPERINLRIDFPHPIQRTLFVETVDKLMDESYRFSLNKYPVITSEVSDIVFPEK